MIEQELSETRRNRGESDGLFNEKDAVPTNVVRSTHDIFAGSQVETGDDLGQLKFLHTPQYKVEAAHVIQNQAQLVTFTDQAREQCHLYVTRLVEDWQTYDERTPGQFALTKQLYRTKAFVVEYQSYCESLVTLLIALERKYRELRCTVEAWKVVVKILKQLERARQHAVARMTTGLQDTNSSKVPRGLVFNRLVHTKGLKAEFGFESRRGKLQVSSMFACN